MIQFAPYIKNYQYKKYVNFNRNSLYETNSFIGDSVTLCHKSYISDIEKVNIIIEKYKKIVLEKNIEPRKQSDESINSLASHFAKTMKLVHDDGIIKYFEHSEHARSIEIHTDQNLKLLFMKMIKPGD